MADGVKFIHASDFHLDVSISGLGELPAHMIQTMADSPYESAKKVFDLAIAERVDFALLAGDLFDFESGNARAAAFLLGQFERLAEKDIKVYWCAGHCDQPDRWPSSIELPSNVVAFSSSIVEQIDHRRDGKTVARIMASGFDPQRKTGGDFSAPDDEVFTIAMTHGEFESGNLDAQNIRYWALGGKHQSSQLDLPDSVVAYSGTTQGRTPHESGMHGFNFCRLDSGGKLRVQQVETDRIRFMPQKVAISEQVQLDELKNELGERALKIMADTTDQVVFCDWQLSTEGDYNPRIRSREWQDGILKWLRDEFGQTDKGLWSIRVKVDAPKHLPIEWYEEDTLLGEYLRVMGRFQSDDSMKLNLHEYMPQTVKNKVTSGMGQVMEDVRRRTLQSATMVGVEYLAKHKEFVAVSSLED